MIFNNFFNILKFGEVFSSLKGCICWLESLCYLGDWLWVSFCHKYIYILNILYFESFSLLPNWINLITCGILWLKKKKVELHRLSWHFIRRAGEVVDIFHHCVQTNSIKFFLPGLFTLIKETIFTRIF